MLKDAWQNAREWWCLLAPWHRHEITERLSPNAYKQTCTRCGCEFATNVFERISLPYRLVKDFYKRQPFVR